MKKQVLIMICLGIAVSWFGIAAAGDIDYSEDPATGSNMPTLLEVYEYLIDGTAETPNASFEGPTAGPTAGTMKTTKEIYDAIKDERDSDLKAENIKSGVEIFGVTGSLSAESESAEPESECVAKTGQTTCYDASGTTTGCAGTGQDGDHQKGCDPTVTPFSSSYFGGYNRTLFTSQAGFTNNGDGTVTDNLTGLIWLKNADCFGTKNWSDALSEANGLANGACSLTDGSSAGDWRLPNINELRSLFDPDQSVPYLPAGHPFDGVQDYYWSSTSNADTPTDAWDVHPIYCFVYHLDKTNTFYVWPVRGGQ